MNEISVLIGRDTRACSLSLLSAMWGYNEKTAICKPGSGLQPDTGSAGTLIFGSQTQEVWEIYVYCFSYLVYGNLLQQPKLTKTNGKICIYGIYTYNGISWSHKREWNFDTCYNMDKPWPHCAKWNKPDTEWQILHDFTYMRYLE